jgi:hypothetical protein
MPLRRIDPFSSQRAPHAHRLAAALAVLLAPSLLPARSEASAGPGPARPMISVTNCDDSGPGSLRDAVAGAASGDTIDLDGLACSGITLTSGEIAIPQDDLVIKYSGTSGGTFTVGANLASRVFHHTGHGTLTIEGVVVADGKYDTTSGGGGVARGGCIESEGNVSLSHATVSQCSAQSDAPAYGGGIAAAGTFYLSYSTVDSCGVSSPSNAFGGGILLESGPAFIVGSTISNNATSRMAGQGLDERGGGLFIRHIATLSTITGSTLSGNESAYGGAIDVETGSAYGGLIVENSTIANNTADYCGGGVTTRMPLEVSNSTVAFDSAAGIYGGGGLCMAAGSNELELVSSIVASNSAPSSASTADIVGSGVTISGEYDLIVASGIPVPPDTIDADPHLLPLADNGGPTRTLALDAASPAIDAGENPGGFANDQRGPGYARTTGAATDIGAYERQSPDEIFANGFD